ncbi:hypothetical protein LX36DRAFT_637337 [Colletotrichum falcatum]|nr:hypothetical protein LX36DRAFT_637337 [Colletotrichum falcatum]
MKNIVNIYKAYLHHVRGVEPHSNAAPKPFIRLNIQCIIGSYDPNVTAAKDEVLFANETKVLSLFEEMCKEMYLPTEHRAVTEIMEECVQMKNPHNKSPHIQSDDDGEQLDEPLGRVIPDSAAGGQTSSFLSNCKEPHFAKLIQHPTPKIRMVRVGDDLVSQPSSINGTHIAAPVEKGNFVNSLCNYVETHQQNQAVPIGYGEALYGSPAMATDDPSEAPRSYTSREATGNSHTEQHRQSFPGNAELQHDTEPIQYLLRTGWEVDMGRHETASPEGNAQPIFLDPPKTDLVESLQSQRLDQEYREKPNPWAIAKKAADKRGAHEHSISSYPSGVTQRDDAPVSKISCGRLSLTQAKIFVQRDSNMAHLNAEDQGHIQSKHHRRQPEPVVQSEDVYEAGNLESPILQYPPTPQGDFYVLRQQVQRRIARDDEPFRPAGKRHDADKLAIRPDPGVRQHGYSKMPHPLASFNHNSALGTPPPSSSPLHKPFTVPTRVGPRKPQPRRQRPRGAPLKAPRAVGPRADGLRQGEIALNARWHREPLTPKGTKGDCSATMEADYAGFRDNCVVAETLTDLHRLGNDDLSSKDMEEALERLSALRPRTRNTDYTEDQGGGEERGRALSRRSATTAPDTSPRSYLRRRLASRSRSRSKAHKRIKSEMLPFEKLCSETYTHIQSLTLDLTNMQNQAFNASYYDLYVVGGQQEAAFPLNQTEMEDISNRLQEVLGAWAVKEHGAELELEIDIGALFEGSDTGCYMTE